MKEVVIKKSELAIAKGLGKSSAIIAKELGIKIQDVRASMKDFGLLTERDYSNSKGYKITLVDDLGGNNSTNNNHSTTTESTDPEPIKDTSVDTSKNVENSDSIRIF